MTCDDQILTKNKVLARQEVRALNPPSSETLTTHLETQLDDIQVYKAMSLAS